MKTCKYCNTENENNLRHCKVCNNRIYLLTAKIFLIISLIPTVALLLISLYSAMYAIWNGDYEYVLSDYCTLIILAVWYFWYISVSCFVYQIIFAISNGISKKKPLKILVWIYMGGYLLAGLVFVLYLLGVSIEQRPWF